MHNASTMQSPSEKGATVAPKVWAQDWEFQLRLCPQSLLLQHFRTIFLVLGCLLVLETLIFCSDIVLLFCLPSKQSTNWFFKC